MRHLAERMVPSSNLERGAVVPVLRDEHGGSTLGWSTADADSLATSLLHPTLASVGSAGVGR